MAYLADLAFKRDRRKQPGRTEFGAHHGIPHQRHLKVTVDYRRKSLCYSLSSRGHGKTWPTSERTVTGCSVCSKRRSARLPISVLGGPGGRSYFARS